MDDAKAEALHIMIAAQGLLIEHLWANVLADQAPADSLAIKQALIAVAGNSIEAYSGTPRDVAEIQAWGMIVQQHMRSIFERIEQREQDCRKQRGQPPLGKCKSS